MKVWNVVFIVQYRTKRRCQLCKGMQNIGGGGTASVGRPMKTCLNTRCRYASVKS